MEGFPGTGKYVKSGQGKMSVSSPLISMAIVSGPGCSPTSETVACLSGPATSTFA